MFSDAFSLGKYILRRFKCQVARDKGANYNTVCYCCIFRICQKSCIESMPRDSAQRDATRRNATRRRGFPEDDGGRGFIRGIISCLVGFVGGKQSAQGCCRQTYYRRISYIHTFARCASKLLSLPHGTRAGIVPCFSFLMLHR